jgi:hypothetical protein
MDDEVNLSENGVDVEHNRPTYDLGEELFVQRSNMDDDFQESEQELDEEFPPEEVLDPIEKEIFKKVNFKNYFKLL